MSIGDCLYLALNVMDIVLSVAVIRMIIKDRKNKKD